MRRRSWSQKCGRDVSIGFGFGSCQICPTKSRFRSRFDERGQCVAAPSGMASRRRLNLDINSRPYDSISKIEFLSVTLGYSEICDLPACVRWELYRVVQLLVLYQSDAFAIRAGRRPLYLSPSLLSLPPRKSQLSRTKHNIGDRISPDGGRRQTVASMTNNVEL